VAVDKSRLVEVTSLAKKLIQQGHGGAHVIQDHRSTLEARWVKGHGRVGGKWVQGCMVKGSSAVEDHRWVRGHQQWRVICG